MQSRATTSSRPSPIRQDYLQSALKWISGGNIEEYTSKHQFDDNAFELWQYFQTVINWTRMLFPNYRKEMRGLEWGDLYNTYRNNFYDSQKMEADHIAPWCEGGRTDANNCQMLYRDCNRRKGKQ